MLVDVLSILVLEVSAGAIQVLTVLEVLIHCGLFKLGLLEYKGCK